MFGNNRCHERLVQSSFCSRVCLFQIICACIWQCRYIQDNYFYSVQGLSFIGLLINAYCFFFSGDGKTHYVLKELKKKWHNESIVLSVNESFDPSQIIRLLRGTKIERRALALFLKFTLPRLEVGCIAI